MKIIATTRTRNEELNIERFCQAYGTFCDEIIIVDGGSEDKTVEIAKSMPKTFVFHYKEKVWSPDKKYWRNPHGEHINLCQDLAYWSGADWVIFDDCDSVPNITLQKNARKHFETSADIIELYRLYLLGQNKRLKKMEVSRSLWAWRPDCGLRAREADPWKHEFDIPAVAKYGIDYPDVLLHYFAPTEEIAKQKGTFYRESGELPNFTHSYDPHSIYWPPEDAPDWAVWK